MTISPTSNPEVSAGVSGSIADTTTGLLPWILKPNSSFPRRTTTVLSLSVNKIELSNEPCKIHAKMTRRRKSTKMCQGRYEYLKKKDVIGVLGTLHTINHLKVVMLDYL